ncbi:unnamed protein product [Sphagnum balticum]
MNILKSLFQSFAHNGPETMRKFNEGAKEGWKKWKDEAKEKHCHRNSSDSSSKEKYSKCNEKKNEELPKAQELEDRNMAMAY